MIVIIPEPEKAYFPMPFTELGIEMDLRAEQSRKVEFPIYATPFGRFIEVIPAQP